MHTVYWRIGKCNYIFRISRRRVVQQYLAALARQSLYFIRAASASMPKPELALPKYALPAIYVVGACVAAQKLFPQYKAFLEVFIFFGLGVLFTYLAFRLPQGFLEQVNKGRTPFRKIPAAGKHGRVFFLGLGIVLMLAGVTEACNRIAQL